MMKRHDSEDNRGHRARLEAVLRNAVDAIITIDERGIVQSANPATEKLFGYQVEEVVGQNVKLLMPAPYRDEHDGYMRNYLETGRQAIIGIGREVVGRHKDGSTFPIHLAVSEAKVGQRRLFTGIVRDLTALRHAEAESTSLGRIIEESLNELYFIDADSLQFKHVNRGACENLGYDMSELCNMTPLDIKPEFTRDRFLELIAPLRSGQREKLLFETKHLRKDGSTYDVEVHMQMGQSQGRPVFVAIVLDTTVRKEAERQLSKLNEELERRVRRRTEQLREAQAELLKKERLATLGQVSGGIAHEIRNPLSAVKTSAYFLMHAKSPSPEKVMEHLERIDRQVTLIDNVITALSDVAKLPEAKLEPISIRDCLLNVLETTSIPASVTITSRIPGDLPPALADKNQMPIVFRNLVRNARDAMPEGGTITVDAEARENLIHVSIQDEGIGISPDELDRIMEPLYSTKARGMGLGLAIAKAIVEKNLGEIKVRSELGTGSSFRVTLQTT